MVIRDSVLRVNSTATDRAFAKIQLKPIRLKGRQSTKSGAVCTGNAQHAKEVVGPKVWEELQPNQPRPNLETSEIFEDDDKRDF